MIRYSNFADGEILTADQLLNLQNNGVVQVDTYSELAALESYVNTAYCIADHTLYTRKADASWSSTGGLAIVDTVAPTAPQVGQIWFDGQSYKHPVSRQSKASEVVSATSWTEIADLSVNNTYKNPMVINVRFGAEMVGANADTKVFLRAKATGTTTVPCPYPQYYATHTGTSQSMVMNMNSQNYTATDVNTNIIWKLEAYKSGTGNATLTNIWLECMDERWVF